MPIGFSSRERYAYGSSEGGRKRSIHVGGAGGSSGGGGGGVLVFFRSSSSVRVLL